MIKSQVSSNTTHAATEILGFDEEEHPVVQGVVALTISSVDKLHCPAYQGRAHNTLIKATMRNVVKQTGAARTVGGKASWGETKHFPVTVIRNRKHPFNLLQLQVMAFDVVTEQTLVGSAAFHLHDIVMARKELTGVFDLLNGHTMVGEMALTLSFSYGLFGYGYSNQLKDDARPPEEHIRHSLYPRVDPPEERMETSRMTLVPKAVPHPTYIPMDEPVLFGYGKQIGSLPREHDRFPLLRKQLTDLPDTFAQYRQIGARDQLSSRKDKLAFLHQHIVATGVRTETQREADGEVVAQMSTQTTSAFLIPSSNLAHKHQKKAAVAAVAAVEDKFGPNLGQDGMKSAREDGASNSEDGVDAQLGGDQGKALDVDEGQTLVAAWGRGKKRQQHQ